MFCLLLFRDFLRKASTLLLFEANLPKDHWASCLTHYYLVFSRCLTSKPIYSSLTFPKVLSVFGFVGQCLSKTAMALLH